MTTPPAHTTASQIVADLLGNPQHGQRDLLRPEAEWHRWWDLYGADPGHEAYAAARWAAGQAGV